MNKLIGLTLLLVGCGQQITRVSESDFDQVLQRGPKVERLQSSTSDSLTLTGNTGAIYQVKTFSDNPSIIHKLQFDTQMMQSITGSKQENCLLSIDTHKQAFGLDHLRQLEFVSQRRINRKLFLVSFKRAINGIPVKNAYVDCYFYKSDSDSYKLSEIVNNGHFHQEVSNSSPLTKDEIKYALSLNQGQIIDGLKHEYLASSSGVLSVSNVEYQYKGERYTLIINNDDGSLVQGAPHKLHMRSTLIGEVHYRSYLEQEFFQDSLPMTPIISSEGVLKSDRMGYFESDATINGVQLKSERVTVYQNTSATPMNVSAVAQGAVVSRIRAEDTERAGLNGYASIHRINKYVRQYLSPEEVPFLDQSIEVRVNQEGECNAYYTTGISLISLCRAGGGCANVALVNDVIYHEWGHALDDHTGREKGVTDGAFSEGIGDVVSAYFNQDPVIGIGFVQDESYGIRRIDQLKYYPYDIGQVHREGGIIAGAFWFLHEKLIQRMGRSKGRAKAADLFFKHLLTTDTYLDSYESVLRIDDDDGNPATPSPNHCLINEVFSSHGLAEEELCNDEEYQEVESDKTMNLALYNLPDGEVSLVASSSLDGDVYVCFGSQEECLASSRIHLRLSYLNESEEFSFYNHQGSLNLTGTDYLTLIRKDGSGEILGVRVLKIFTR